MLDFLLTPTGQAILMAILLAVMILVGVLVLLRFRDFDGDDQPSTGDLLSNFKELRDGGDISDEEFRKLKTALHDKGQRKPINDDGETG